jgi:hypothetical protein
MGVTCTGYEYVVKLVAGGYLYPVTKHLIYRTHHKNFLRKNSHCKKTEIYFPGRWLFYFFSERRMSHCSERIWSLRKKNSGYFLNLPVPFRNFLLFPSNYRIFWKDFPNFSGIQFLSYYVQNWEIKHNNIGS